MDEDQTTEQGGQAADSQAQAQAGQQQAKAQADANSRKGMNTKILIIGMILLLFVSLPGVFAVPLAFLGLRQVGEPSPVGTSGTFSSDNSELAYPASAKAVETSNCINNYLQSKRAAMAGEGDKFNSYGSQYNVNPGLMIAIGAQESSLGKAGVSIHGANFNYYGMTAAKGEAFYDNGNAKFRVFASWDESIGFHARYIRTKYFDDDPPLRTIAAIHTKYAPVGAANDPKNLNSEWVQGVTSSFNEIVRKCPQLKPQSISTGIAAGTGSLFDYTKLDFRNFTSGQAGPYTNIKQVLDNMGGSTGLASNKDDNYKFFGFTVSVDKRIEGALDQVQKDIKASGTTYKFKDVGGYRSTPNVNNPSAMSAHNLGLALDINPDTNPNKNPRPAGECPHDIPKEVSDAFLKNGFFWGAKFRSICDAMHFQYGGNYQ